ncbi:MAG: FAD binding domain-containing protein [Candidatus Bipolaricaulota bacterium]|nr:FAD binding domain-containing protein [Candidatus Bipolaricaulota bacterium]
MSLARLKEYLQPASLDEALTLLQNGPEKTRLIGGGIDIVLHNKDVERLIDLSRLSLAYVNQEETGISVGATTTMTQLLEASPVQGYLGGIIPEVLHLVASPLLRNLGTIGGTLASAHPWSDIITLFLALAADVTLFDGEHHTVPLVELYRGKYRKILSGAIITGVFVPNHPSNTAAAFRKFSRTGFDIALLNCACLIQLANDRCSKARVVAGGTPWLASRLTSVEEALIGEPFESRSIVKAAIMAESTAAVHGDTRASADYRRELIRIGIERCLIQVMQRSSG